jgi:hypothetical protein
MRSPACAWTWTWALGSAATTDMRKWKCGLEKPGAPTKVFHGSAASADSKNAQSGLRLHLDMGI